MIQVVVAPPNGGIAATGWDSDWGSAVGARLIPLGRFSVAVPAVRPKGSSGERFCTTMLISKNCLTVTALPRRISHWIPGCVSIVVGLGVMRVVSPLEFSTVVSQPVCSGLAPCCSHLSGLGEPPPSGGGRLPVGEL